MNEHTNPSHSDADDLDLAQITASGLETAIKATGNSELLETARNCRTILGTQPRNAEARHTLGRIAHVVKKLDLAARLIESAAHIAPQRIDFVGNLGNVYQDIGRFHDAIACFRKVIAAVPTSEMAHNNLGNLLQETGDLADAAECFERAIAIRPDFFVAWNNLGPVLQKLNRPAQAVAALEQALKIKGVYISV